uniref:Uncharacterized protein n=1 Tax=Oryza glaberrima TaxID=4538 RepID=I1PUK6_ORYGL
MAMLATVCFLCLSTASVWEFFFVHVAINQLTAMHTAYNSYERNNSRAVTIFLFFSLLISAYAPNQFSQKIEVIAIVNISAYIYLCLSSSVRI